MLSLENDLMRSVADAIAGRKQARRRKRSRPRSTKLAAIGLMPARRLRKRSAGGTYHRSRCDSFATERLLPRIVVDQPPAARLPR